MRMIFNWILVILIRYIRENNIQPPPQAPKVLPQPNEAPAVVVVPIHKPVNVYVVQTLAFCIYKNTTTNFFYWSSKFDEAGQGPFKTSKEAFLSYKKCKIAHIKLKVTTAANIIHFKARPNAKVLPFKPKGSI